MKKILKRDLKVGDYVLLQDSDETYWNEEMCSTGGVLCRIEKLQRYGIIIEDCIHEFHWKDVSEIVTDTVRIQEYPNRFRKDKPLAITLHEQVMLTEKVGTCSFALRWKEKNDVIKVNDVCHAAIIWTHPGYGGEYGERVEEDTTEELLAVVNSLYHHHEALSKIEMGDSFKNYIHWVINKSPWANICLTKDVDVAINEGVYLDVTKNISMIVGACIAMREGHEYHTYRLHVFDLLASKGYSGNVAYLCSGLMRKRDGGGYISTGFSSGHQVLSDNMIWEELSEFFKRGYDRPDLKGMNKDPRQYEYEIYATISPFSDKHRGDDRKSLTEVARVVMNKGRKVVAGGFGYREAYKEDDLIRLAEFFKGELE